MSAKPKSEAHPAVPDFEGFPREGVQFLKQLKRNNDRGWFEEHRETYERQLLEPARSFVVAMGKRLHELSPMIHADPRVNGSIFRIIRDLRRVKGDPYKTHLGILFWEGWGERMECSGYYFHLEPPTLTLCAGLYMFTPQARDAYRAAVVDENAGPALAKALAKLKRAGPFSIGGSRLKRVPAAHSDHPNAALLLHEGLWAEIERPLPRQLSSPALVDHCFETFRTMSPLHEWLVTMLRTA